MRRFFVGLTLFLSCIAASAHAQDPVAVEPPAVERDDYEPVPPGEREAQLRFEAGTLALDQGRLEEAQTDFARACALAPTPDRWLALAGVQEALRRDRELLTTYRAFLAAAPEHPRAAEIRARAAILERTATTVVPAPPAAAVAVAAPAPTPAAPTEQRDIFDEPWFWAVVAVVVGGGILAALFLTGDQGTEDPLPGDEGIVIRTLVEAP